MEKAPETDQVASSIRNILRQHCRMPNAAALANIQDLYAAGLTSFSAVQLMLALEEVFDIEFPERMLNRRSFASIDAIARAVGELCAARAA